MATLNGFTRPSDPISATDMLLKLIADTGLTITNVEVTPTDVLVTGPTLTSGNAAAIQSSMTDYSYTPLQYPTNAAMYADDDTSMAANSGTRIPTQRAVKANLTGKRRTYVNGVPKNGTPKTGDIIEWIDSVTTTSGNAVFYVTSDHTSSGIALCSEIYQSGVDVHTIDNTASYARGSAAISGDFKSVTISLNKQVFSGIVLLSTNLLGSVTYSASPNGTTVNATIIGIAA